MCAYNSINGQPACANQFLLQDSCAAWDFQGYVVSDCGAVRDIYQRPSFPPDAAAGLCHLLCSAAWTTNASISAKRSRTITITSPISRPCSRAI